MCVWMQKLEATCRFSLSPISAHFISCQLMRGQQGATNVNSQNFHFLSSGGQNPAVPLVVTNVRIQTLLEILPQILLHFRPARGHPPNPSSICFHPLPAQILSQYTTLFFLTISSLEFKPNCPWKVPSLYRYIDMKLLSSAKLQFRESEIQQMVFQF